MPRPHLKMNVFQSYIGDSVTDLRGESQQRAVDLSALLLVCCFEIRAQCIYCLPEN